MPSTIKKKSVLQGIVIWCSCLEPSTLVPPEWRNISNELKAQQGLSWALCGSGPFELPARLPMARAHAWATCGSAARASAPCWRHPALLLPLLAKLRAGAALRKSPFSKKLRPGAVPTQALGRAKSGSAAPQLRSKWLGLAVAWRLSSPGARSLAKVGRALALAGLAAS